MKRVFIFLLIGSVLSLGGMIDLLNGGFPLSPLVVFLGFYIAFFPWSVPSHLRTSDFDIYKTENTTATHEPLLLARYFIAMSIISRRKGILSLLEKNFDTHYKNGLYRMGKNMMIDGIAPEFVQQEFSSVSYALRQRYREQIGRILQTGKYLAAVTVISCVGCGSMLLLRGDAAFDLRCGVWICTTLISAICAISVLCLLPGKMCHILYRRNLIDRQIQIGFDCIQQGKSPIATALSQIPYLTVKEQAYFSQMPLPEDIGETQPTDDFSDVAENIGKSIREICHYQL